MGLLDKFRKPADSSDVSAQVADAEPASQPTGVVSLKKGDAPVSLRKESSGGKFTLICQWGKKDYDLYALVEYADGHVETVACFGTVNNPRGYTKQTKDGAVKHVSGDQVAYGLKRGVAQEVIKITLNDQIKTVVPVVYSAINSGAGSFQEYQVSTYIITGDHDTVPQKADQMVRITDREASSHRNVYTCVPAVIRNSPSGAQLEAATQYSRPGSEQRPTVKNGKVTMDNGETNTSDKD